MDEIVSVFMVWLSVEAERPVYYREYFFSVQLFVLFTQYNVFL